MLIEPLSTLLRSRWVAALSEPRGIDHYVSLVAPTWSAREIRARIVRVHHETSDTTSLLLEPNQNWPGFRAGQHVSLTVTIDGVRHMRTFSISSAPSAGTPLRITIRAFRGGLVSNWAARCAERGERVVLGPPRGSFVLPQDLPPRLLFVTGGSGVTPIASMLRELASTGYAGETTCLHYARNELIFGGELTRLTKTFKSLRFVPYLTRGSRARLSRESLDAACPGWRGSEAFVCGPEALERSMTELWRHEGLRTLPHVERFAHRAPPVSAAHEQAQTAGPYTLRFARSGLSVKVKAGLSLLAQAEAVGLTPAYGCRMGICHTCERIKHSGVVRDARTGQLSGPGCERVRLCASLAASDVTLDL